MNWNEIGEKIKKARKKKKLTQVQLAEKLGVSSAFICQLESGKKKTSVDNLAKLSKILGTNFFNKNVN